MIRYRIPSNLYNFKPMMFGVELRRLLIFLGIIFAAILIIRIDPLAVLIFILATTIITFVKIRGTPILDIIIGYVGYFVTRKEDSISFGINIFNHNSRTMFSVYTRTYLMLECSGINLLELSHKDQVSTTKTVQSLIDSIESSMDIVCLAEPIVAADESATDEISKFVLKDNYRYLTLILLSLDHSVQGIDKTRNKLALDGETVASMLASSDIDTSLVNDEDLIFRYLEKWLE